MGQQDWTKKIEQQGAQEPGGGQRLNTKFSHIERGSETPLVSYQWDGTRRADIMRHKHNWSKILLLD